MKTNQGFTQFEMKSEFLAGNSPYSGKILRVNLSTGEIWVDEHDDDFYRKWIGGRGLIVYYLLKETNPKIDPLGPDNLLIFAPGILTGTVLPGTGRHAVGGKITTHRGLSHPGKPVAGGGPNASRRVLMQWLSREKLRNLCICGSRMVAQSFVMPVTCGD